MKLFKRGGGNMQTINDRIGIILDKSGKTKTAFGESLKVSQQYISKLIRTGNPSDLLISDICEKYNISEKWLRTGEGDMYIHRTRSEKIADFAADLLKEEEESFKRRLIEALADLDVEEWEILEKISEKAAKKRKG